MYCIFYFSCLFEETEVKKQLTFGILGTELPFLHIHSLLHLVNRQRHRQQHGAFFFKTEHNSLTCKLKKDKALFQKKNTKGTARYRQHKCRKIAMTVPIRLMDQGEVGRHRYRSHKFPAVPLTGSGASNGRFFAS